MNVYFNTYTQSLYYLRLLSRHACSFSLSPVISGIVVISDQPSTRTSATWFRSFSSTANVSITVPKGGGSPKIITPMSR